MILVTTHGLGRSIPRIHFLPPLDHQEINQSRNKEKIDDTTQHTDDSLCCSGRPRTGFLRWLTGTTVLLGVLDELVVEAVFEAVFVVAVEVVGVAVEEVLEVLVVSRVEIVTPPVPIVTISTLLLIW